MQKIRSIGFFLAFLPLVTFAQAEGVKGYIQDIGSIIQLLTQIAFAAALLFFFWGMAKFILHAGDESGREEGKEVMKWGIVALFVIFSIWGIVAFIRNEFEIDGIPRLLFHDF